LIGTNQHQEEQIKKIISLSKSINISIGLHLEFLDGNFEMEIKRQYKKFVEIFGFKPSHFDVHKPTIDSCLFVSAYCKINNFFCRNIKLNSKDFFTTDNEVLSGTNKSFEELQKYLEKLKENESYEILFHPGNYDPDCKSSLNKERELDNEKIKFINTLLEKNNIKLISYLNLVK
jgi:predicted glycoside hydrolase/deacetylase ChbG (UPF0249 family)